MDKRIVKTRLAVFNAVLDLSADKEMDDIKVIEICEKAHINKSTFYLHYTSIEDCFKKCMDFFTDNVIQLGNDIDYEQMAASPEAVINTILDGIEERMDYIIRYKNSVIFETSIRKLKTSFAENIFKNNNLTLENNYRQCMKVIFIVGGCLDAIIYSLGNYDRDTLFDVMKTVIKRAN